MTRAESVRVAQPLFQEAGGGSIPTSALDLWFMTATAGTVIELNRLWHSRLPKVVKSNIQRCSHKAFFVAEHGGLYYASAIWTNPVARGLPSDTWLELRRFAIAPDHPKNTASRMLGWMAREVKRMFPVLEKAVSYQDMDVHTGTIYRAAGWTPTTIAEASYGNHHQWSNKKRKRAKGQSDSPKQRWEKVL